MTEKANDMQYVNNFLFTDMGIGSQFINSPNVELGINYGRKLMYVSADIARTPSAHEYDTVEVS